MRWLASVVVGVGAAAAVWAILDNDAREAGKRWEDQRESVRRTVEEHRANIERYLDEAESSYDFHLLTDLHFSSHRVADHAYSALRDARHTLDVLGKMLVEAKEKRTEVRRELSRESDPERRRELHHEVDLLNDLRSKVFPEKDAIKAQRNELHAEVRRLNARTLELKLAIRDRCGPKGEDWYERLEARTALRRALRGYS